MATTTKYTIRRICAVPAAKAAEFNKALYRLDPAFGQSTFSIPAKAGTMMICDIALTPTQQALLRTITTTVKQGMVDAGSLGVKSRLSAALKTMNVADAEVIEE